MRKNVVLTLAALLTAIAILLWVGGFPSGQHWNRKKADSLVDDPGRRLENSIKKMKGVKDAEVCLISDGEDPLRALVIIEFQRSVTTDKFNFDNIFSLFTSSSNYELSLLRTIEIRDEKGNALAKKDLITPKNESYAIQSFSLGEKMRDELTIALERRFGKGTVFSSVEIEMESLTRGHPYIKVLGGPGPVKPETSNKPEKFQIQKLSVLVLINAAESGTDEKKVRKYISDLIKMVPERGDKLKLVIRTDRKNGGIFWRASFKKQDFSW